MPDKWRTIDMNDEDFKKSRQSRLRQRQPNYQEKESQLLEQVAIYPEMTFEEEEKSKHVYCPPPLRFGHGTSIKQFTRRIGIKKR